MPYSKVLEQLKESLQTAYRQAIDADAKLDELKKAGHGKFKAIFPKEQGFTSDSNRFQPYIAELVAQFDRLQAQPELDKTLLEDLVRKLGSVLQTMQSFKQQSK